MQPFSHNNKYLLLTQIGLPESMKVAVLINCHRLFVAYAYHCFWLILEIYTDASVLSLNIDKSYMMLREHRVCNASDFYLDHALIESGNYRDMLLKTCINCSRDQLLHLLSTAYNRY